MPVEKITFEDETGNRQGGKRYSDRLTTGGTVEDVAAEDRAAVDVAVGTELIRVRCPWTPAMKAARAGKTFRLRGDRFSIRSRDRTDNAEVLIVGERVGA